MKFEIRISTGPDDKRKSHSVRGFTRLTEACAAAFGVSSALQSDPNMLVAVWLPKARRHHSACLCVTRPTSHKSHTDLVANCEHSLQVEVAKRKASDARWKFLGAQGRDAGETFAAINSDDSARDAFFRNDLATVEKFLATRGATA